MKEELGWNQPIWVPKEVIINMKGASNGLSSKGHLKALSAGTWEAWRNQDEKIQAHKPSLQIGHMFLKFLG
jgi:hypothetical protein